MNKERWFIRSHGHTMGPLSWKELEASIMTGDFNEDTKVSSEKEQTWTNLFDREEIKPILLEKELKKVTLVSAPPPSTLFKKKKPFVKPAATPRQKEEKTDSPKVEKPALSAPIVTALAPADPVIAPEVKIAPPAPKRPELNFSVPKIPTAKEFKEPVKTEPKIVTKVESKPSATAAAPITNSNEAEKILELRIPITRQSLFVVFAFIIAVAAYFTFSALQKTRDLKDSHLSDPPSPTIEPSEENDPILPLKAPTRPQRD